MGQALYRKHRPKSLKEVVGQEHITKTLEQALKQGRISHAYLFTGPRGVGKTSIARILAHEINELPYADDSTHMDIIEIDAASNRRIDEIRELRDKVYVAPTSAKYKVYIIDEVHMLTREAFNALLKTLEEPPAHVVFILATTDAHKLPETIISRTQRFSFRPGEKSQVAEHLRQIAKMENIKISDEALELLAEHSEGSFRDSVSLLDQARSHAETVEVADIHHQLGIPPAEAIQNLITALTLSGGSNAAGLMGHLTGLYEQGYQPAAIAKQLGQSLRSQLLEGKLESGFVLQLLEQLIEVPTSHQPERFLEITLLRALPPSSTARSAPAEPSEEILPEMLPEETKEPEQYEEHIEEIVPKKPVKPSSAKLNEDSWPEVLQALKKQHNTLYGVIRMAQPDFSRTEQLSLAFAFGFHQKRLQENGNQQKLADIILTVTGQNVLIECIVDKAAVPFAGATSPAKPAATSSVKSPAKDLTAISNIFGDAELLES